MRFFKFVFLATFLSLFSCGTAVKTLAGFKNPKVESKESVVNYLAASDKNLDTYFLAVNKVKDSTEIYKNLLFGFNSDLYLFNSQSGSKYCYKGTEECSGTQMQSAFLDFDANYSPCADADLLNLKKFLNRIVDYEGNPLKPANLPSADYYIFQTWNIYTSSKKNFKEDMEWLLKLKKESNQNIEVLFVNTDLLDEWGLEKDKKLPIKFKKEGKSMTLNLGELPIEK